MTLTDVLALVECRHNKASVYACRECLLFVLEHMSPETKATEEYKQLRQQAEGMTSTQ